MFEKSVYIERRQKLMNRMGSGLILLLGNGDSPRNFRDNAYSFRQDSSFLYYFGLNHSGFDGLLDCESGEVSLFADDLTIDDYVWTGVQPTVADLARTSGVDRAFTSDKLPALIDGALSAGRTIHTLPPYRAEHSLKLGRLFHRNPAVDSFEASRALIEAVADQRNHKEDREIEEIVKAVDVSVDMHCAAMRLCRPGITEAAIAAEVERTARAQGMESAFTVIATKNGQTLHNHYYGNTLAEGDLFLLDAGAETARGYAGDLSSTVPVGGRFTPRQREIYDLSLRAHDRAIELLAPGVSFVSVYYESARVIVEGLKDLGIMKGSVQSALEQGAHAMFFPCGLGHLMGLDVHDMENLGEEIVGYGGKEKSAQFGLKSLRLGRELEPGFVLTIEPGIYFIPELMDLWSSRGLHREFIDYTELNKYRDFGGIRNEENFLITGNGAERLGKEKPKTAEDVEAITGSGSLQAG